MTTNNIKNEDISALMDGETSAQCDDIFFQALRLSKNRESWDAYHQIGDVLRSDDIANNCSAAFNGALFTRLAAEPAYLGTAASSVASSTGLAANKQPNILATRRRLASATRVVSGIAAASAALYFGGTVLLDTPTRQVALNRQLATQRGGAPQVTLEQPIAVQVNLSSAVVMRSPQIDAYLIAHQRFSPSLSSTAQFARSANFATDSVK